MLFEEDVEMSPVFEHVRPETAELLADRAKAQGLSVDSYLKLLLGISAQANLFAKLSEEEFEAVLEEFANGTENIPPLPTHFSRADIYCDHD